MSIRVYILVAMVGLVLAAVPEVCGQTTGFFNQRDDQYRLLGLKRAKEAYEVAQQEYQRQQALFDKHLISATELDQAHRFYSDAEVNYQQSLLAVLFEKQYISVSEAVKYQAADGRKHVRLTLANTSGGTEEFRKLINIDDQLFRSLQPDIINNVYVSLLNDDQAIISQPYEAKISQLQYGDPQQVDFILLQDLDAVTVYLVYANGNQRAMKIFLQKDASVNRVLVQSEQFSQEVELGEAATFDLTLELFSGTENTFSLLTVNLPQVLNRFFKDPNGSARLSQVKFTESGRTKKAALEVSLPDRPTEDIRMNQAIPFYVVVVPTDRIAEITESSGQVWTETELEKLDVGFARLELIPRGRGKLLVRSPQMYHSIRPGESVAMSIDLINEGSQRLDNAEVQVDAPIGWRKEVTPRLVPSIEIGEEKRVDLSFIPPNDIVPGKYEVRLRTSATSNSEPVTGLDKTITVEIRSKANIVGTTVIVLCLVALVGGMVVFGIRLSRR